MTELMRLDDLLIATQEELNNDGIFPSHLQLLVGSCNLVVFPTFEEHNKYVAYLETKEEPKKRLAFVVNDNVKGTLLNAIKNFNDELRENVIVI